MEQQSKGKPSIRLATKKDKVGHVRVILDDGAGNQDIAGISSNSILKFLSSSASIIKSKMGSANILERGMHDAVKKSVFESDDYDLTPPRYISQEGYAQSKRFLDNLTEDDYDYWVFSNNCDDFARRVIRRATQKKSCTNDFRPADAKKDIR